MKKKKQRLNRDSQSSDEKFMSFTRSGYYAALVPTISKDCNPDCMNPAGLPPAALLKQMSFYGTVDPWWHPFGWI